jgi:hypothetical protein
MAFDPIVLLAFVPLTLFIIVLYWGKQKKDRQIRVSELVYSIIALQLLSYLLLPICEQPFDCSLWAIIPFFMFAAFIYFKAHRMHKEAQHHLRIAKAMAAGHVDASGLMQAAIEEDLAKAEKEKPKIKKSSPTIQIKEEPKPEEPKPEEPKPEEPKPEISKENLEHKEIENLVDSVIKKKKSEKKSKKS